GKNRKTQAPRIDLTPMVDLGFLLITFFMFTTTLAQPKALALNLPADKTDGSETVFIDVASVTLLPGANHTVAYYNGLLADQGLRFTTIANVRAMLQQRKAQIAALPATFSAQAHKMHVLIKPTTQCKYADVVGLLDEMLIVDVPFYTLADVTPDEIAAVAALK
ncbi:MAG: biopolymer transporter ExbD, partial [Taibaiella sp.]|nr:biopolymer transporter ExbD [Taibaiella sp.]